MAEGNGESNHDGWSSEEERLHFEVIMARVNANAESKGLVVDDCCQEVARSVFQVVLDELREKAEAKKAAKVAAVEDDKLVAEMMHGYI